MTVSTRSRPKAAGAWVRPLFRKWLVSTRSRPKAAGYVKYYEDYSEEVSTRSRPKAAGGSGAAFCRVDVFVSTRSRPKAAGKNFKKETDRYKFQHAAARRRLGKILKKKRIDISFNTQPPEGGWYMILLLQIYMKWFQHAAARRRLVNQSQQLVMLQLFQHAAARRRLGL